MQILYQGQPLVKTACGAEFSMVVDCKGNIYSFGCPEYGQLGRLSWKTAALSADTGFSLGFFCCCFRKVRTLVAIAGQHKSEHIKVGLEIVFA